MNDGDREQRCICTRIPGVHVVADHEPKCSECKRPMNQSHAVTCPYGGLPR